MVPLGLITWLAVGLLGGWLGRALLPGRPPLGWLGALAAGLLGAVAGGVVASLLGFGGIAAYDPRSLATATLTAMLALFALRLATLADRR